MQIDWLELSATGSKATAELASLILIEAGSPGVEETQNGRLRAFLKPAEKASLEKLKHRLSLIGWTVKIRPFRDKNWLEEWKRFVKPVRIKPLFICQSLTRAHIPPGYIPVEIEPSMAFGTGTHPSTRLALKAMVWLFSSAQKENPSVLDVGTGSGILAICAKKLGAHRVVATDIDELALRVARKNARKNKTPLRITAKPLPQIRGSFSLVVANIIKDVLLSLSEGLVCRTKKGGHLVLSGLLREDVEEIVRGFSSLSVSPVRRFALKEWVAVVMKKP